MAESSDTVESEGHTTTQRMGAAIQSFKVKTDDGWFNIVLNFPNPSLYAKYNEPYFGETIGRVANRISGAIINNLDGKSWKLTANNPPNCLHGGKSGWGKKIWSSPGKVVRDGRSMVEYCLKSEHEEEGFPGTVETRVWYAASTSSHENRNVSVLEIEYEAELVGSAEETAVAMTNHTYFNLSGDPTIGDTQVILTTTNHLPVNENLIPFGIIADFPVMQPNKPFTIGAATPRVDHCFVHNPTAQAITDIPLDTRRTPMKLIGSFFHPKTRIHLQVFSTEPAFQFYTGEYIDVPPVKDEKTGASAPARGPRAGFCVEPSRFVNAVNNAQWRHMVLLKKGEKYGSKIMYRAWQGPKPK